MTKRKEWRKNAWAKAQVKDHERFYTAIEHGPSNVMGMLPSVDALLHACGEPEVIIKLVYVSTG